MSVAPVVGVPLIGGYALLVGPRVGGTAFGGGVVVTIVVVVVLVETVELAVPNGMVVDATGVETTEREGSGAGVKTEPR